MLTRSVRPEDLEMPLSGFSDYLTPVEHFFARTHVYVPIVNINEWGLNVSGSVATPFTLTMDDLKKLPAAELIGVSGVRRERTRLLPASGARNAMGATGAVGNARWRGTRSQTCSSSRA